MIALLVAERMLRDFATSTVFESGAGVCAHAITPHAHACSHVVT